MPINNNLDLVENSFENLSNAQQSIVKTDMEAESAAGNISKEALTSGSEIMREIGISRYYASKGALKDVTSNLSAYTTNQKDIYNSLTNPNDLNESNAQTQAYLDGVQQGLNKLPLTPSMKQEALDKVNYYRQQLKVHYGVRTSQLADDQMYYGLKSAVGNVSIAAGKKLPDISNLVPLAHRLLDSPTLSLSKKQQVSNTIQALNMIKTHFSNDPLQNTGDQHTDMIANELESEKGTNNYIRGLFINGQAPVNSLNVNLMNIQPNKLKQLFVQQDEIKNLYQTLGTSKNLPLDCENLSRGNDIESRVGILCNQYLKNNQAQVLVQGLDKSVRNAWQAYQNADQIHKAECIC